MADMSEPWRLEAIYTNNWEYLTVSGPWSDAAGEMRQGEKILKIEQFLLS